MLYYEFINTIFYRFSQKILKVPNFLGFLTIFTLPDYTETEALSLFFFYSNQAWLTLLDKIFFDSTRRKLE